MNLEWIQLTYPSHTRICGQRCLYGARMTDYILYSSFLVPWNLHLTTFGRVTDHDSIPIIFQFISFKLPYLAFNASGKVVYIK